MTDDLLSQAENLSGLYTGMCDPEEYQPLIDAGLLTKDYSGPGGVLGLSKLRKVETK